MPQSIAKPVKKGLSPESLLERMLAYNVEDSKGNRIGHVSALWVDPQDRIEFVGIKLTRGRAGPTFFLHTVCR